MIEPIHPSRRGCLVLALVVLAVASALPFGLDAYQLHWAITVLKFVVLALGWDLLARTGQVSFGHAGFFGLGAYVAALGSAAWQLNQIVTIALAGAFVGVLAGFTSVLFLRVRGIYFAILTLAFAEVFRVCATMLEGVTGGAMGVSLPPMFGGDGTKSYFLLLAIAALCIAGMAALERSRLHFGMTAMRSGPDVAAAFGIPVRLIKVAAFAVSASLAGMMGAFYGFYTTYVNPESAFDIAISVAPVIMSIFGGLYTIAGPLIGAVFLTLIQEYLRTTFEYGSVVIYGLLLIVSILFMPNGVWGVVQLNRARLRSRWRPVPASRAEADDAANP